MDLCAVSRITRVRHIHVSAPLLLMQGIMGGIGRNVNLFQVSMGKIAVEKMPQNFTPRATSRSAYINPNRMRCFARRTFFVHRPKAKFCKCPRQHLAGFIIRFHLTHDANARTCRKRLVRTAVFQLKTGLAQRVRDVLCERLRVRYQRLDVEGDARFGNFFHFTPQLRLLSISQMPPRILPATATAAGGLWCRSLY